MVSSTDSDVVKTVTPVAASRQGLPPATIKSTPRLVDPMVTLYNKAGEPEQVLRDNVRDYIQHLGYTQRPYKPAQATTEDGAGEEVVGKVNRPSPKEVVEEPTDTAKEIVALREKLDAAGVKVDSRWGLKRLREVAADLNTDENSLPGGGDGGQS